MLRKRGVSWVLALALALVGVVVVEPATAAAAVNIAVPAAKNVRAQMATHYGSTSSAASGSSNFQAIDCVRFGSGAATSGTLANPGGAGATSADTGYTAFVANGSAAWVAHGTSDLNWRNDPVCPNSLDLDRQSAIGFAPASVGNLNPGTIFNLGRMAHRNTGIYLTSGNEYFRGKLNLQFLDMELSFNYEMHETTGVNAADTTTFLNQLGEQSFTHGGLTYTLVIRGFTAPQSGSTCNATLASLNSVTTTFTTPENATTSGCLYAQVQQVRTLKVQKQVLAPYGAPATYPGFGFTASSDVAGSPWAGNFTLQPTGPGAAGQAVRLGTLVTGQTINIAEAGQGGNWAFTGLTCVDGDNSTSIPGLTVSGAGITISGDYSTSSASAAPITCTWTNTYTPRATLTLVKQVTPTGQAGTVATPADWTLSATGTGAVAGQGASGISGAAAVTNASLIAGTYTLGEVPNNAATTAGYVQDGAWSCTAGTLSGNTLTLAAGQSATCTVRNKYSVGRLAITKTVTGAGYTGGTSGSFTAAYTCTAGTATVKSGTVTVHPGAGNGTPGAAATIDYVPAGSTCIVTESDPPTGTSTGLVDGSWVWGAPVNPAPVTITADQTATVNLTNPTSQRLGSFQVTTAVSPRSGVPGAGYSGGADRTFPISYECRLGSTMVSSGTLEISTGTSRTVTGLPASSDCTVTGEDQAARAGDFLDASYAWDGYTASAGVTVPASGTATVTVTNHFRRDLATLELAKVVTGNGYAGSGDDFRIDYACGAPYEGTVSVAAGGSESVTVPAGVACTVSERRPADSLLRPGYVWGDPTYSGLGAGTVTVPAGGSRTVTVTNPTSIGYNRVQVTKAIDSFADQVTSGTVFEVRVSCDRPAQGAAADYAETFDLLWPSAPTALTPYLPAGTSCTVTQTGAPGGQEALPNASYAWQAGPDPVTVTVPASDEPREVTVTSDIRRVYAAFTIAKEIVNHTGHGAGGERFSGSYRCDYNGEDVRSGAWSITGAGTAASVDVLVGSVCTVTEDDPGTPVAGDRSYTWSTQTPEPTTVGTDGATATVVNTLNRAEGSFNVTKSVQGGLAGEAFAAGADFEFSYRCTPLTGDVIEGSLRLGAGDSAAPGQSVPGGSTCTVTEADPPAALDPFRWDGVDLSASGAASGGAQDGRSITFTTTDDAAPVSVSAVNSISAKTASVRVTKAVTGATGGFTGAGGAIFPVTLTCTGAGAQGTRLVAADGSATWDGIPLGATCSASEGTTTDGLRDGSYAWQPPAIGDAVKLTDAGQTYEIGIQNPITRVRAGIEITKVIDDNGFSGVLDADRVYSGAWSCQYGDDPAVSGTWSARGSSTGTVADLTGDHDQVLVGSRCSVTEDSPGTPSHDPSYRWDAPGLDQLTVAGGQPNRMSVTNTLLRDTGRVRVTKQLAGETAGFAPADGFAGFSVTARCYLDDPAEEGRMEATVPVLPGDTATVLDGVPFGWRCQVSEGSFPAPSQLRDASYAWDAQAVSFPGGGDTTTVTAADDAPVATVTNSIRRVTGTLAITKAFGDGTAAAVRPGTTFTGDYRCTYGSQTYSGTWTVTGAGPATLHGDTDLPFTADCTASEDVPSDAALVDSSYAWAAPDLGGTVTIASAAEPAELTVTNSATRRWSGLEITHAYDGPEGAFDAGLVATGTWACTYRGDLVASGGWALPATGGSQVVARPEDHAIPAESDCVVAADSIGADQLTDASYAWGPVGYTPAGGSVATTAGHTARVSVTHSTSRVLAPFVVAKQVQRGNGVAPEALEANLTFSGDYRCTHPGDDPVTGTWGPVAADAEWTGPAVLVGSACEVTVEEQPAPPANADDSYLWGEANLGEPVTVTPSGEPRATITVTNPVHRVTGSFGVTKTVTGDVEGIGSGATYGFQWSCTAANGNRFPAGGPGTFGLTAGSTWNAPDGVPVGSTCVVAETSLPAPDDASYTWSTELAAANTDGVADGRTITFELPRSQAPVVVTATNTLARTHGSFAVSKSSDPGDGATVVPGQAVHYSVEVTAAEVGFTRDVVVTDDLSGVLPHADVTGIATTQGEARLDGDELVWTVGTVAAGATLQLSYTATVHPDAVGVTLRNRVAATGETPPDACTDACTTEHHTPAWTLSKTSDPATGTVVEPGDVITYTLTARNTSAARIVGAAAVDDLSGLADAQVAAGSPQLARDGDRLTWSIPELAPGEHAQVSYTATVNAGADGTTLANSVTPSGAGGTCLGSCATSQATARWTLAKSSDPGSGSIVEPGQVIGYTLTVTNTGPVPTSPVVRDDLVDLVDDAELGDLPDGVARDGDVLTWAAPELQPGQSASVGYTATVAAGARGATLANTASPASVGGHCEGSCTTTSHTDAWTLAKASDAGDGATVRPGEVITYTLTVRNDGPVTLRDAVVADDLSDVLDDATLGDLPAGASRSGDTLRWAVPDVAPGQTASLDYRVTVAGTAVGATLRNVATAASTGGSCAGTCTTTQYTPAWTLAKTSDPATGSTVAPGATITYTLTATNTGPGVVSGATAIDDLAGVLGNAEVAFTSSRLQQDGSTLTWVIPTLQPGEQASVSYTATVKPEAAGISVTNTVVPSGAGGSCLGGCATTQSTPKWSLTKTSDPGSGGIVVPGDVLTYTLTVANEGPVPVTGAVVADDVSDLVDDAELGDLPGGLTRSGDELTWTVPVVGVGEVASISYTATVRPGATGAELTNVATPVGAGGHCVLGCATTSYTDGWTLAKTSDVAQGATVATGDTIGYTLQVTNTGRTTLLGARVLDDLADVLDDATLGTLPATATLTGTSLVWLVPDLAPGATATLEYRATVNPGAAGARLRNIAVPAGRGGTCDASCSTTQYTAAWTLAKTSDPGPGVVEPGAVLTYTLTATNTSQATITGARATDDLSGLVASADVELDSPQLSRSGDVLTWAIPDLAPGQTRSVTYTATVVAGAHGATLTNTAAPAGDGGSCASGCSTTHTTPAWTLAKTSDPGDGGVVAPGDVVGYTLTVTNTGPAPLTGAVVTDDVSGLTDDTVLGDLPAGLTRDGDRLTWAVPDVAVGASRSITYSATVAAGRSGATLANVAAPASSGGSCAGTCSTRHYTAAWSLAKSSGVGPGATVEPGDTVDYLLTVTNDGPAPLTGAVVTDDLGDVLDDATLLAVPAGANLDGTGLTWLVPDVAPGSTASLAYRVQVAADAVGATLRNVVAPASIGGECVPGACVTTAHTPRWTLAKTSDPATGTVVRPGDVITYTLTATNTSAAQVRGALAVDDLSGVTPHAELGFSSDQLSLAGDLLTWAIPVLEAGESASVTYTATVRPGATGATLVNSVSPVGAGGSCVDGCATTQWTSAWTLAKTSDPGSGAVVRPGDVITYTLTVANTGPVPLTGAVVADDLDEVLDDALVADLGEGLARSGGTLVWDVPQVPVGGSVSVDYTATVAAGADGATITNTAVPVTAGGTCVACSTTHTTPAWTLAKTSGPGDGAIVVPGQVVDYTLAVTNTGPAALSGAEVSDDLTDVLDDAALVALPDGARLTGTTLTWSVPEVPAGGTAELHYQVRLDDAALGATLRNTAAPLTTGGRCAEACETVAYTTAWTLAKTSDPGTGATVEPGERVTYTLTVANTGPVALAGAVVVDDMSDLLDDAELTGDRPEGTTLDGELLRWSVPEVPVGGSASISYAVTVRAGAYGVSLGNVATGEGVAACGAGAGCATRHYSPAWTLEKTSDPASGSVVVPGSQIRFNLRVRNTSDAVVAHALVTDDLGELLQYALLDALPDGASLAGSVITWTVPTLQPGEEVVLSYTVTVDEDAYNAAFRSPATPGAGGTCPVDCSTEHTTLPAVVDPVEDDDDDDGRGGAAGGGTLAYTGGGLGALGAGLGLLLAGTVVLVVSRRRRGEDQGR